MKHHTHTHTHTHVLTYLFIHLHSLHPFNIFDFAHDLTFLFCQFTFFYPFQHFLIFFFFVRTEKSNAKDIYENDSNELEQTKQQIDAIQNSAKTENQKKECTPCSMLNKCKGALKIEK